MKSRKKRLREVYVWELPVRIYHWVNALCIVILCVTGFIIADPPAIMSASEAYFSYWFGVVRFIHFVTAFVFFFNFVFRLYWGFVGNRYARWNNFIPLKKSQWKEVLEVIKVDILMIKNKPVDSIGHNALASLIYFGTFWAFLLQSITGFGLYAKMSQSFFPQLFAWTVPLMDGGTGGLHLLSWLQGYDRIIMIDATLDNNPPGTVRLIQPRYATDFPPLMSAHEIGLKDMIDAMILTDDLPETHLIVISALNINEVGMDLTPEVKAAVPKVIRMIQEIISIHNRAYRQ